jgi:hypothetical protein
MDTAIIRPQGPVEPTPAPHLQPPTNQEVSQPNTANRVTTTTPRLLLDNTVVVRHNIRAMAKVRASTEDLRNSNNTQAATDHKQALVDIVDKVMAELLLADMDSRPDTVAQRKVTTADPATTTTISTIR